ncbi:hypothetical protein [Aeromicrobium stalagmiti]|uniref:hypothetical protein n=1 Tax=Aeromicrobium stalagmiti TaxID=2738988 RepID=UPI001569C322|nr:hypothetical protein [Aeromicrobium stalagmiti]NRQ51565.1 hypothetical protein [Aeromicrobium stalagmiti]
MNRPKSDKWPPYKPTRHVLIKREDHRFARPFQGFVVDWKRTGKKWEALVVFMDERVDGMPLVQTWFPIEQLMPCHPDPNPRRDEWF